MQCSYGPMVGVSGTLRPCFSENDVKVTAKSETRLGNLKWQDAGEGNLIWQIGTIDRKASEFKFAGPPPPRGMPEWTSARNLVYIQWDRVKQKIGVLLRETSESGAFASILLHSLARRHRRRFFRYPLPASARSFHRP